MTGSVDASTRAEAGAGELAPPPGTRVSTNQASPIGDHDAWAADPSARWWLEHVLREVGIDGIQPEHDALLGRVGRAVGSVRLRAAADRANRNEPRLATWDGHGTRLDDVEFDPAWDECIDAVTGSGVCGLPWLDDRTGYLVRGVMAELWGRIDLGVMCPVTMTAAAVPVLARDAGGPGEQLRDQVLAAAAAGAAPPGSAGSQPVGSYGPGPTERGPFPGGRRGRHPLIGMAMTEPQGGSDLAGSTVTAVEQPDGSFRIDGHKWFCSHPVVDALLVLAREPGGAPGIGEGSRGLSCFLVPGWLPDGVRNGIELQRLKDKLGTRSLASAEVVFRGASATRIGRPGRGVPTIIEMVVHTRMDCVLGSAGIMARAVGEAVNNARGRAAFGATLVEQPLMRVVLADLLLEREGALALAVEVARGFQVTDPTTRLVTAIAKYWVTRRAVSVCVEACEALGGNGYTEEFPVARLYRDAQVNSTWEGSGNVMALDLLRALGREPQLLQGTLARLGQLLDGAPDDIAAAIATFAASIEAPTRPADARRFAGRLAVALQAALLAHRAGATGARARSTGDTADAAAAEADATIARAFVATRLEPSPERVFGDGDSRLADAAAPLLARAPIPV